MKLIRPFVFLILVVFNFLHANAQQIEVGILLGTSHYLGDLSDEKINFKNTYFAASLFGRYNFSDKLAVSGMASYGRVSGDDKQSSLAASKLRNLNFYSDIFEFSVRMEYNLLKNDLRNLQNRPFIPYVFGGIGVFKFNPKTELIDPISGAKSTVELQPLKTEGQGSTVYNNLNQYNLTEIIVPLGIGFRTRISDVFCIGFETGIRLTSTNYLDDVGGVYADNSVVKANSGSAGALLADRSWEIDRSWETLTPNSPKGVFKEGDKRSNKTSIFENDVYFISGITISYLIRSHGQPCPTFFH